MRVLGDSAASLRTGAPARGSAFERLYDMILSYGTGEYVGNKKKIVHYNFFDDGAGAGIEGIRAGFRRKPMAGELGE